jgi:excisionase family DNA binding protein
VPGSPAVILLDLFFNDRLYQLAHETVPAGPCTENSVTITVHDTEGGDYRMASPSADETTSGSDTPPDADMILLTVEEAARRLSLGRTTFYGLLKEGQIASVRIGRLRRIPAEELTAYTARLITKQHAA